jgi:acetyl-CoA carboxylase biotin carboxyl carrier protein
MRPKEIKKLIELVEQSNINELEVNRWGKKVRILKSGNKPGTVTVVPESNVASSSPPIQPAQEVTLPTETTAPVKVEPTAPTIEPASDNIVEVKSPMVGTFYRAPAPDADPYVQVGDIVSPNQVLCIIEAMKLMNEIESEWRGRIIAISVENAQPIEYNQVLFKIEKL